MKKPIAVIPARNEAGRLSAAFRPLTRASLTVIVVANGCSDETAAVAARYGAIVVETRRLDGGVGEARRIGMAAALQLDPPWVLTTDADAVLGPGTVALLGNALTRADAVFGRVVPDPSEFAALPPNVRLLGELEERQHALEAEIEAHECPLPWNPSPCHGQSPGALMAFRPEAYRASGGFRPIPCHEDRAMAQDLARVGARVARPAAATVLASCRLIGRAQGGMASTIAERVSADLSGEIERLGVACAALERRMAHLHSVTQPRPCFDLQRKGGRHVLPLVQASV